MADIAQQTGTAQPTSAEKQTAAAPPTGTGQSTAGQATEAAREVGGHAKQRVGDLGSTAGEEARAVVGDAKAQAREVVAKSRDQLRAEMSTQTDRLSSTLLDIGDQLRGMSRGEVQQDGTVANLTTQLADTATNAANRLQAGGLDGAMNDVKRFARNHPGTFLLGALGAGFVVGRVLKAADLHSVADAAKQTDERDDWDDDDIARLGAPSMASSFDAPTSLESGFEPGGSTPTGYGGATPLPSSAAGTELPPEVP